MTDAHSTSPQAGMVIVDDDPAFLHAMQRMLESAGYAVRTASDAESALVQVRQSSPAVVLTDLVLPRLDGVELLRQIKEISPTTEVLVLTGQGNVEKAVEAMKLGAYDFVLKQPVNSDRLLIAVAKAVEKQELAVENRYLRDRLSAQSGMNRLLGTSPAVGAIKELIAQVAPTEVPILITGESGTGKEVVADVLHDLSPRRKGTLVKISCAAIPENLLESELFGYERGAFSGAIQAKPGRFELAHGGTLFLDEIAEMAPVMQAKLLRVLQDGVVQRLGSTKDIQVDARVFSATNVDIESAIHEKKFREDLYHRLNVVEIHLPPLRERLEDLSILAQHFVERYSKSSRNAARPITPAALHLLRDYRWPGNVRELENAIQRALATAPGKELGPDSFQFVRERSAEASRGKGDVLQVPADVPLAEIEKLVIDETLRRCGGNKEMAARALGISTRTIYRHASRAAREEPSEEAEVR